MNFWETNNGYSAMEFLLQALDTLCDAQNKANQIAKERNAIEREKLELLQKKAPEIMEQPDHEIRKDDSYQWANRKSDPYQWLMKQSNRETKKLQVEFQESATYRTTLTVPEGATPEQIQNALLLKIASGEITLADCHGRNQKIVVLDTKKA